MDSGGSPFENSSLARTRGKMTMGGTYVPAALMHITAVHSVPRSAEVNVPTCFLPFIAITLDGRPCTVVRPVSSTLKILDGAYANLSCSGSSKSKKLPTADLLKPLARAADVASGFLRER